MPRGETLRIHLDDDVLPLDFDRVRLCDVRPLDTPRDRRLRLRLGDERRAGLDRHVVGADAEPLGLAPGLAGADVVFPAVPGTGEDLALAREAHLARHGRLDRAPQLPLAQRAALVGAAVAQREVLALHVEDADRAAGDLDDLPPAGWDLVDGGDDVLHSSPYSSTALR